MYIFRTVSFSHPFLFSYSTGGGLIYRQTFGNTSDFSCSLNVAVHDLSFCSLYLMCSFCFTNSVSLHCKVSYRKGSLHTFSVHSSKKAKLASMSDTNDLSSMNLMNICVFITKLKNL